MPHSISKFDPAIILLGIVPQKCSDLQKDVCVRNFTAAFSKIGDNLNVVNRELGK